MGKETRNEEPVEIIIALEDAPAEAWRGLGLMLRRSGDAAGASEAFKSYLAESGITLTVSAETKTKAAMEFFARKFQSERAAG